MSLDIKKQIVNKLTNKHVRTVAIAMHNSPDGDAIGSAVALEKSLLKIGKKVDIIIQNKISSSYSNIIGKHRVNRFMIPPEGKTYDVVILVDCADAERTWEGVFDIGKFVIVIDHHYGCTPIGDLYLYERAASTGMIIYKIIKMIAPVDEDMASALYLTIRSDTGSFKNTNTDVKAHEIAGELLFHGANLQMVNEIYDNKQLSLLRLMGQTFAHIIFDRQHKIIHLIVRSEEIKKAQSTCEEASTLIDYLRGVEGVEIALLFMEGGNNVRVKARSKHTNISEVMSGFGGGGHPQASGALIWSDDIYSVAESVVRRMKEHIIDEAKKEGVKKNEGEMDNPN